MSADLPARQRRRLWQSLGPDAANAALLGQVLELAAALLCGVLRRCCASLGLFSLLPYQAVLVEGWLCSPAGEAKSLSCHAGSDESDNAARQVQEWQGHGIFMPLSKVLQET